MPCLLLSTVTGLVLYSWFGIIKTRYSLAALTFDLSAFSNLDLSHFMLYRKITFELACNRWMTFKVTQGHQKWRDSRPYITSYYWSVVTASLFCTISEILYHFYGVRNCPWPWRLPQFRTTVEISGHIHFPSTNFPKWPIIDDNFTNLACIAYSTTLTFLILRTALNRRQFVITRHWKFISHVSLTRLRLSFQRMYIDQFPCVWCNSSDLWLEESARICKD